jgi:hypothetical protein
MLTAVDVKVFEVCIIEISTSAGLTRTPPDIDDK